VWGGFGPRWPIIAALAVRRQAQANLAALTATGGYPEDLRELVEQYLLGLRFAEEAPTGGLDEAMRYSLLAGGKRIRPVLALATARAIGRDPADVLPYALYAEAFRHVLTAQRAEPAHLLAALGELAAATGVNGMVGGQYMDVAGRTEDLRHLHALKTGRLIGASIEGVLLLSGRAPDAFRAYADELGVLFQIVDDILDVTGSDADLGKPHGSDERHGKRTYVSRFGLEGARTMAHASYEQASAALAIAAPDGAPELERITDFIYTRTS
jgi:geranylgeranyl diphosphate synthase type II